MSLGGLTPVKFADQWAEALTCGQGIVFWPVDLTAHRTQKRNGLCSKRGNNGSQVTRIGAFQKQTAGRSPPRHPLGREILCTSKCLLTGGPRNLSG